MKYALNEENMHYGDLILINRDYKLKQNRPIDLVPFSKEFSSILLERKTMAALHFVLDKIGAKDDIVPVSGYRTKKEQEEIFNTSLKEDGEEFTLKYVALPDTSEHQSGYAIDLGLKMDNIDFIRPSFPYYGICNKYRREAVKYGFIERYHESKTAITKISKEEWHFRYVGYPHSEIINKNNFCLEEYIDYLKEFKYNKNPLTYKNYEISYIKLGEIDEIEIDDNTLVSGNNADGFIVTRKK